jgi:hypothetical protein
MPLPEDKREAILRDIANGMSLSDVCKQEGYPHRSTVYDDLAADAGFADKYARACELRAEVVFDEIFDIADNATNDWMEKRGEDDAGWIANGENIQRSRLRIDARKWALSKMAPKKYGDKLDLNHSGEVRVASVEMTFVGPESSPSDG